MRALLATILLTLFMQSASMSKCIIPIPQQILLNADIVVVGEVIGYTTPLNPNKDLAYNVKIEGRYVGLNNIKISEETVWVYTSNTTSCGLSLELGGKYIIPLRSYEVSGKKRYYSIECSVTPDYQYYRKEYVKATPGWFINKFFSVLNLMGFNLEIGEIEHQEEIEKQIEIYKTKDLS